MRALIAMILMSFASFLAASPVGVDNIRVWSAPESTRIVFDLTGPVEHQLTNLVNPFRVVIDISNAKLKNELTQPSNRDHHIQRLRSAIHNSKLRVVFDLKKSSHSRSFQLNPNGIYGYRLVLDIFDKENSKEDVVKLSERIDVNTPEPRDIIIAVDAGHGGEDPGSIGSAGTYEKNVALVLAKKLANKINSIHGMRALLIREGDYYISLRDRIDKARRYSADLFVSIHADSFKDPRVSGSSVYVLSQKGTSSEHARWLAKKENASDLIGGVKLEDKDDVLASVLLDLSQTASLEASIDIADRVLEGLKKVGKLHKPKVESAAFAVLKSPDIPSLLIETAYISNPQEEKKLKTRKYQDRLVNAIVLELENYFRNTPPVNTIFATNNSWEYVIIRGDTLSEIALRYRVSLQNLRRENRLITDKIKIGQKLIIPFRGS